MLAARMWRTLRALLLRTRTAGVFHGWCCTCAQLVLYLCLLVLALRWSPAVMVEGTPPPVLVLAYTARLGSTFADLLLAALPCSTIRCTVRFEKLAVSASVSSGPEATEHNNDHVRVCVSCKSRPALADHSASTLTFGSHDLWLGVGVVCSKWFWAPRSRSFLEVLRCAGAE